MLELIEREAPALADELFGAPTLAAELQQSRTPVHSSPSLRFTHNEPAVNLYTSGGCFAPHKDLQALTVLVPLVSGGAGDVEGGGAGDVESGGAGGFEGGGAGAFEGGGTGFWARPAAEGDDSLQRISGTVGCDVDAAAPSIVLAPPAGSALLFGGELTHSGQPVTAGQRAVFVASFSRGASLRCGQRRVGAVVGAVVGAAPRLEGDAEAASKMANGGGGVGEEPGEEEACGYSEAELQRLERAMLERLYGGAAG